MAEPLLEIRGLKTHFATEDGMVQAVDGVDLTIARGETLGVVGESGCGKTVTALTVLKLIAMPPGRIGAGQILWQGRDLVPLRQEDMNDIRSKEIAVSFLNFGIKETEVSWGNVLANAQTALILGNWWWAFFPGMAIALTVIAINFIGDGLRDALDPRSRE